MARWTLLLTLVAAFGCGRIPNKPRPAVPRVPELTDSQPGVRNPIDRERGVIYRGEGDTCYVNLPFDEPPAGVVPYPTEAVVCPPSMLDVSWEACRHGRVDEAEGGCTCFVHGDPPSEGPVTCPTGPAADPAKPTITTVQAGLDEAHRGQRPLLDRIEHQSHGRTRVTRVYEDGSQYTIVSDPLDPEYSDDDATWSRFVPITPAGIERVREVISTSVLAWDGPPPPTGGPSGDAGRITWVVFLDGRERVVQTSAGTYDSLPPFVRELDEAVSQHVRRAE